MKKTSIFLILATVVALMFTSCSSMVNDNTNATMKDFEGTWYWSTEEQNNPNLKSRSITATIENNKVTIEDDKGDKQELVATVSGGILTASSKLDSLLGNFFGDTLEMTIKQSGTLITVTGSKLKTIVGKPYIHLTRGLALDKLPFIPNTEVTFSDYEGTWRNSVKNAKFTFTNANGIQLLTVHGLGQGISLPGLTLVVKGVATTTIQGNTYIMYMNKNKNGITVTGPAIKNLTGEYCFNLERYN